MRILIPYLLLLVLLFFAARSYARRSARARRNVLAIGWGLVASLVALTLYLACFGDGGAVQTAMTGLSAAAMLGYGVRSLQRRTRHVVNPRTRAFSRSGILHD